VPVLVPVKDTSTPYVVGQRVLAEMLISAGMRHGVVSVAELTVARVGGQGVVLLPLSPEDVSVPYVVEQGVLVISSASAELTVTSVDRQGVLSVSLLVEDLPV